MIAGKMAVVCGYGDVGKGCARHSAAALRSTSRKSIPFVHCRPAAEGYQVVTMDDACKIRRHLCHRDRQPRHHHPAAHGSDEHNAIVCNIGHFDSEIQMRCSQRTPVGRNQTAGRSHGWPNGKRIIVLAKGRAMNLGCAKGIEFRDVEFLQQPNPCPNGTVRQRQGPERRTSTCRRTSMKRWPGAASRTTQRQADEVVAQTGQLYQREIGRAVQAG